MELVSNHILRFIIIKISGTIFRCNVSISPNVSCRSTALMATYRIQGWTIETDPQTNHMLQRMTTTKRKNVFNEFNLDKKSHIFSINFVQYRIFVCIKKSLEIKNDQCQFIILCFISDILIRRKNDFIRIVKNN